MTRSVHSARFSNTYSDVLANKATESKLEFLEENLNSESIKHLEN